MLFYSNMRLAKSILINQSDKLNYSQIRAVKQTSIKKINNKLNSITG